MLSREYLNLYLKKAHFTSLEHLLFRIAVNGEFPDDMYFSSRVRETLVFLVNEIRKKEAQKNHTDVAGLYKNIDDVINDKLGGE